MSAVLKQQKLTYRRMQKDDLPRVIAIEICAYPYPWTLGIFNDCLRVGYSCFVAESDNNTVVGYGVISTAAGECHILNLCIDVELQGCGYGRELLNYLMNAAGDKNVSDVFLEVRPSNKHAVHLYESIGFAEVGLRKDYYPADKGREDAVIFAKNISGY